MHIEQVGYRTAPIWINATRCQSEISDFTPCAHAWSNTLHIKFAEETDD